MSDHPIMSIEEPFHQDDWGLFHDLTSGIDMRALVVTNGDLLITNRKV